LICLKELWLSFFNEYSDKPIGKLLQHLIVAFAKAAIIQEHCKGFWESAGAQGEIHCRLGLLRYEDLVVHSLEQHRWQHSLNKYDQLLTILTFINILKEFGAEHEGVFLDARPQIFH
jgi:hypothetical protein